MAKRASKLPHPVAAAPGAAPLASTRWWNDGRAGLLIFALAAAVRLAHLFDFARLPLFTRPTVDAALYVDLARRFAETGALPDVFFKPPVFPVLLGLWWRLVGESWFWLRLPFALTGAVTALLAWMLARRLFGPVVALVAGLLYALHSSAVYLEGELLEMGVVTCAQTGALLVLLRVQAAPRRRGLVLAGVALGLGIVARPTFLLFGLLALLVLTVTARRRVGWALVGLVLCVAPVTLHNLVRGGDFVLVSSNVGLNFYIGNNPNANGRIVSTPELPAEPARARREARRIAEVDAQTALTPSEVSRFWLRRGIEHATRQPVRTARLLVRKMFFLWSGTPLSDNEDLQGLRRWLHVYTWMPVGMWLLAPLGLLGWLAARARPGCRREVWLVRGFVAAQVVAVWPFFVVERFRLAWAPVLAVFAAWTLVELVRRWRHAPRQALWLSVAAVALGVLCNLPLFGVRQPPRLDLDYKMGYAYHQGGRVDAAMRAYRSSITHNPRAADARNALGFLLAERGEDLEQAVRWIEEALALDPSHAAHYAESLAYAEMQRGEPQAALAACARGLASSPDTRTRTLLHLRAAEAHAALGDGTAAQREARRALDVAPSDDLRERARHMLAPAPH